VTKSGGKASYTEPVVFRHRRNPKPGVLGEYLYLYTAADEADGELVNVAFEDSSTR
jgi:hypothetical protein